MDLDKLNKDFSLPGNLEFSDIKEGFTIASIKNGFSEATIALQGAQILTFRPNGQKPVIWLSGDARYVSGKSARGGVPVCWPWFGPHPVESDFPAHGPARTINWQVTKTGKLEDGSVFISLLLPEHDAVKKVWPFPAKLELHVTVGASIKIELVTSNTGKDSFVISEALHTYFHISDIDKVKINGLDNTEYVDKVGTVSRKKQQGAVTIQSEVDRVYLNTTTDCSIEDMGWNRKIIIKKSGSHSTVVWNPWIEKAEKMGDLGTEGYRQMLCVESGNALENSVEVKDKHILSVEYSVETI